MELSKHRDFEVLDAMFAVAEITELDFDRVCRTNLSTWWSAIFDKLIERGECQPLERKEFAGTYNGAKVLTPKKGKYKNVVVVDAKSLYPSVGINYNLSFDTINCSCCQNDPDAKLCRIIPNEFTKDCKFVNPKTDWICKQREGAFPSKLKVLKILINGGYGVFDSLKEFQQRFKEKYDIELEIKNRYDKLLLSAGKKHYIGVEKGVLDNVGFEGEKSDRYEFFHIIYSQLLDDILTKEIDPLLNVRKAFSDLDSDKVDSKLLIISLRVNQDPGDYVLV